MNSKPSRWRSDGVRIIRPGEFDSNIAQTAGLHRIAAVTTQNTGATKLWAGHWRVAARRVSYSTWISREWRCLSWSDGSITSINDATRSSSPCEVAVAIPWAGACSRSGSLGANDGRADCRSLVAPLTADVRQYRGNLRITQLAAEGRHSAVVSCAIDSQGALDPM